MLFATLLLIWPQHHVNVHITRRKGCPEAKFGAVIINAMLSSREVVFEWNLAALRQYYNESTLDIFIVNNGGPDSEAFIFDSIQQSGIGQATAVLNNHDAVNGYGYEFGAVRAASRALGWLDGCIPYNYVMVMQSTMMLLRPIDLSSLAQGHFKRFLHFEYGYDTLEQREWVAQQLHDLGLHNVDAMHPKSPGDGAQSSPCKGVFGPAWLMSSTCALQLLSHGAFEVPRVQLKWHQTGTERLLAHMVAAICDVSCLDKSLDGDIWSYPHPFEAFDPNVNVALLAPRFIMKKWGSHKHT